MGMLAESRELLEVAPPPPVPLVFPPGMGVTGEEDPAATDPSFADRRELKSSPERKE